MERFLKQHLLSISVCITGACVLIVEIVAVRALSPHFGNTIFTVSSVISVILAALSIGYYVGGKYADRHPSLRYFFGLILLSGLTLLAFHSLGTKLLPVLGIALSLTVGPLVSSLLLFFFPALLLGALSPYAVKLQSVRFPEQGVGSVAGNMFFWSTLGSIAGSLLAGFVLIPRFGIDYIFIATSVVLFVLGLAPLAIMGFEKKRLAVPLVGMVLLIFVAVGALGSTEVDAVYVKDGIYEKIVIYDGMHEGRPTRFFQQDRSTSGAMFLDSSEATDLVYDYTDYYSLYKVFKPDVQHALVIGGGAYSIPKALLAEFPNATIDVSEIEPSLYDLAKEYFGLPENSRLQNHTEDGRRFLRDSDTEYDLIFSDVYYSLYSVPAHFTTREFFLTAKEKLSEEGIFIANFIGDLSRQQPSLSMAEMQTFRSVFPNSYFFAVESPHTTDSQNIIFVGYNSDTRIDFDSPNIRGHEDPIIQSLADKAINLERFDLSLYPVLTDDFSPVEYMTAKVLKRTTRDTLFTSGNELLAIIDQQLRYGPRYMSAPGHTAVQKFLITEMSEHTSEVRTQAWDYAGMDGSVHTLTNVIGRLYPTKERRIILATHYDSKKFADKDLLHKDRPVPGANDSASGVAILVELARILGSAEREPNVGVDIVFFDGEEGDVDISVDFNGWEPLGSTYFAENLDSLYGANLPISALVLDMVCDKDLSIYKERFSAENAPGEVEAFWSVAQGIDAEVFRGEIMGEIEDDHVPLNRAGIPSILLIDFTYPPHHTISDTLDKCSAESLETVARAVFEYVYSVDLE